MFDYENTISIELHQVYQEAVKLDSLHKSIAELISAAGCQISVGDNLKFKADFIESEVRTLTEHRYIDVNYEYEGPLEENLPHGYGTKVYNDGFASYQGNFVNGKYHGEGTKVMGNNGYYTGTFVYGSYKQGK